MPSDGLSLVSTYNNENEAVNTCIERGCKHVHRNVSNPRISSI